jgi:hypothetical protein
MIGLMPIVGLFHPFVLYYTWSRYRPLTWSDVIQLQKWGENVQAQDT